MGRLVSFFTGKAAPEAEPTAGSTAPSTALPTAQPTTPPTAGSTAALYFIREAGVVVDIAGQPPEPEHPIGHALVLLRKLVCDSCAGEHATEKTLRTYYLVICRKYGMKPLPWLSVLRHFNALLKLIYGPVYRKTYKRLYERGRPRQRRVYRIPLLAEFEAAQDVAEVA
jgi:hypothetical protein